MALSGDPLTSNAAILSVWAAGLATGATGEEAAQAGLDFFAELNAAGNFVPIDGDSRTVGIGETPILIDWSYNSIANDVNLAGNPDIETVVPEAGRIAGVYVQAISAFAPHPNAAKLWMEYLYSDEGQLGWASGFCHPIRFEAMSAAGPSRLRWPSSCPAPRAPSSPPSRRSRPLVRSSWKGGRVWLV